MPETPSRQIIPVVIRKFSVASDQRMARVFEAGQTGGYARFLEAGAWQSPQSGCLMPARLQRRRPVNDCVSITQT